MACEQQALNPLAWCPMLYKPVARKAEVHTYVIKQSGSLYPLHGPLTRELNVSTEGPPLCPRTRNRRPFRLHFLPASALGNVGAGIRYPPWNRMRIHTFPQVGWYGSRYLQSRPLLRWPRCSSNNPMPNAIPTCPNASSKPEKTQASLCSCISTSP